MEALFYPRHLATPTTHDLYPRPTTHDPRHLATLFAGKPLVASQNVGCFLSYHRNMSGKLKQVVMFMRLSILFLLSRPFQSLSMPSDCNQVNYCKALLIIFMLIALYKYFNYYCYHYYLKLQFIIYCFFFNLQLIFIQALLFLTVSNRFWQNQGEG